MRIHGVDFAEAVRRVWLDYSGWQARLSGFLTGRFGSSTRATMIAAFESVFGPGWPMPQAPRLMFMNGADEPTSAELDQFAIAAADRLLDVAGL